MFEYIDHKIDYENCKVIICLLHRQSSTHFYIHWAINKIEEADEIVSFWEMLGTTFFDPTFQCAN